MRGLRSRLALALVTLVVVTVAALGAGTYGFVESRLRDGLLDDASRQAQFNLSVLVPERLPTTREGLDASGLAEAFRLRGDVETIVDFGDSHPWVSNAALLRAVDQLPADLRATVAGGHLGYAWLTVAGPAVAGRRRATDRRAGVLRRAGDLDRRGAPSCGSASSRPRSWRSPSRWRPPASSPAGSFARSTPAAAPPPGSPPAT